PCGWPSKSPPSTNFPRTHLARCRLGLVAPRVPGARFEHPPTRRAHGGSTRDLATRVDAGEHRVRGALLPLSRTDRASTTGAAAASAAVGCRCGRAGDRSRGAAGRRVAVRAGAVVAEGVVVPRDLPRCVRTSRHPTRLDTPAFRV